MEIKKAIGKRITNLYNERFEALVRAKIAGDEITVPPSEEGRAPVINIMDPLRQA